MYKVSVSPSLGADMKETGIWIQWVTDWIQTGCFPTPLNRSIFLKHNCTKTLQYLARCLKDAFFKFASVTDTCMNQINKITHTKHLDHSLTTTYAYFAWSE